MYIGKMGSNSYLNRIGLNHSGRNQNSTFLKWNQSFTRRDSVMISSGTAQNKCESGIYRPNGNSMRVIEPVEYTYVVPDERLRTYEIIPPSERTSYTEKDALLDQYMKQFRINGRIEGDKFVWDSSKPAGICLASQVSEAELERFRQELNEKGLGDEIDWRGVESDFVQMNVGFDNIERLETKADFLASRYAVLKDRIEKQYTGDEQKQEMQKLEEIYSKEKERMADSYGDTIGKFYEGLGQTGVSEEMRNSVLAMIDKKAAAYGDYLAQTDLYTLMDEVHPPAGHELQCALGSIQLDGSSDQWLKQDDAYMAARLRESFLASKEGQGFGKQESNEQALYDIKDLSFAGVYAKSLSGQLKRPNMVWSTSKSDSELGSFFANQRVAEQRKIESADISSKLADMLHKTYEPFMEKFMDALDQTLDENQALVNEKPWICGLVRTSHINRNLVYASYQS